MSLRDLELLSFGVTGEPEDFETILKRGRNRVQDVGSGDEKYLGEIVFDVEIVILERVVLFRIEHFEQCGARVATEVGAKLVDFVEKQYGIYGGRLLHHLNDLTGKGADVRATMTTNLSFVANTAQ